MNRSRTAPATTPIIDSPRVHVYPAAKGVVLLIATTIDGEWVAEFRCLASVLDERFIAGLERIVREHEGLALKLMP